jgi:hypothetical protein
MTKKTSAEDIFNRMHNTFHKWSEEIGDISKAFEKFVPYFQESREGWLLAGRTVDGKRFAPLSPLYAARKLRKYGPKPILVASGKMLAALKGGPGWSHKISAKELQIDLDIPYASYHQDGTSKMPQRNFFMTKEGTLNKLDYAQLLQLIEGQMDRSTEAIVNKSLADIARGTP